MPPPPVFIFMLTRADRTVADARERLAEALQAGIRHIGFKDVGLDVPALSGLAQAIRAAGGTSYLEMVDLDPEREEHTARAALDLGVDVLMGGTRPDRVLPVIAGAGLRYLPFAGRVEGQPSRLAGSPAEILADARRIAALEGVYGLDLLAWRSAGDGDDLVRMVCDELDLPVVIAGSIDSPARIAALVAAGAAGFTIGSAVLEGRFPARSAHLADQLDAVRQALAQAIARRDGQDAGSAGKGDP